MITWQSLIDKYDDYMTEVIIVRSQAKIEKFFGQLITFATPEDIMITVSLNIDRPCRLCKDRLAELTGDCQDFCLFKNRAYAGVYTMFKDFNPVVTGIITERINKEKLHKVLDKLEDRGLIDLKEEGLEERIIDVIAEIRSGRRQIR